MLLAYCFYILMFQRRKMFCQIFIFCDGMNVQAVQSLVLFFFVIPTNCEPNDTKKCKKFAHYFRKQVEEIEDTTLGDNNELNDPRSNLVQLLIKNVKEIFHDFTENTDTTEVNRNESSIYPYLFRSADRAINQTSILALSEASNSSLLENSHDVAIYENLSLNTLLDEKHYDSDFELYRNTERNELLHLSKELKYFDDDTDEARRILHEVGGKGLYSNVNSLRRQNVSLDTMRSCITCNNVFHENCNDPRNKLIPSIVCKHEDDLCYSLHTPFGIIDRGCFNINHNLTTYVCACNLCNYIAISEMPYIFSNKRDWVDNVIELSRTRSFRKSVFNDMSCLRCEVNTTTKVGDMLDSANCLEGNMGNLPTELCEEDEVCAVKAVRSEGYIWRGCSKMPLYNYWWALCNNDLCNYDTIVSIFDYIQETKS